MLNLSNKGISVDENFILLFWTDHRGWSITEKWTHEGKRFCRIEMPPEQAEAQELDERVEKAIAATGCDCWVHNLEHICCDPDGYLGEALDVDGYDHWDENEF